MSPSAQYDPADHDSRAARFIKSALPVVSYAALTVIVFAQEYHLAKELFRLGPVWSVALPIAVDVYVLAAFMSRRDIAWALLVMGTTFAASIFVRAQDEGGVTWRALAEVGLGVVVVIVAWRVNELVHGAAETRARRAAREAQRAAREAQRASRLDLSAPMVPVAAVTAVTPVGPAQPISRGTETFLSEDELEQLHAAAIRGVLTGNYDEVIEVGIRYWRETGRKPTAPQVAEWTNATALHNVKDPVQWAKDRRRVMSQRIDRLAAARPALVTA